MYLYKKSRNLYYGQIFFSFFALKQIMIWITQGGDLPWCESLFFRFGRNTSEDPRTEKEQSS